MMRFVCFGSSLVSAYWNGAATYYRGLLKALAERGHAIVFAEPNAFERRGHSDMNDPPWADVLVYAPNRAGMKRALAWASDADVIVKFSSVRVLDEELEQAVLAIRRPRQMAIFWDVNAPATLDRMRSAPADPLRRLIPRFDAVFTRGGGDVVVRAYRRFGARLCIPIYEGLDPATHHVVDPDPRFAADLAFLGNRLPDQEARLDEFFFKPAVAMPGRRFLLGGNGWEDKVRSENVSYVGHVDARDHNAFNVTPKAVLNINQEGMARYGASPLTPIFEAAGAGACIISDAWPGIEDFLEQGKEILLAKSGDAVVQHLRSLTDRSAHLIGAAARRRVLFEHTYALRAGEVEAVLEGSARLREAGKSEIVPHFHAKSSRIDQFANDGNA